MVAAIVLITLGLIVGLRSDTERSGSGNPGCGGTRVLDTSTGQPMRCTFDDEFDGTSLDPTRWSVVRTEAAGFHAGPECYVDDAQHVSVGGGVLTLTATRTAHPYDCGGRMTNYLSGMVSSSGHFAQQYGVVAVHAELPATAGLQPALWMYPQAETYGPWPNSGEIDIAELFGNNPGAVSAHLHFKPRNGTQNGVGQNCSVADPSGTFHTYTVTWTPQQLVFGYDGRLCARFAGWQAAGMNPPAPFDHPFYLLLEMALGSTAGNLPSATTPLPARLRVDWIRAWGT